MSRALLAMLLDAVKRLVREQSREVEGLKKVVHDETLGRGKGLR